MGVGKTFMYIFWVVTYIFVFGIGVPLAGWWIFYVLTPVTLGYWLDIAEYVGYAIYGSIGLGVALVICYSCYLAMSCVGAGGIFGLKGSGWDTSRIRTYCSKIKRTQPIMKFSCECLFIFLFAIIKTVICWANHDSGYHYYYTYYRDSKGRRRRRRHKRVTYRETKQFKFASWKDNSFEPDWSRCRNLIECTSKFIVVFGDKESKNKYNSKYAKFCRKNRYRDTHFNAWKKNTLHGMQNKISFAQNGRMPCCCNMFWYFGAVLIFMSLPFKLIYEFLFQNVYFGIKKTVSVKNKFNYLTKKGRKKVKKNSPFTPVHVHSSTTGFNPVHVSSPIRVHNNIPIQNPIPINPVPNITAPSFNPEIQQNSQIYNSNMNGNGMKPMMQQNNIYSNADMKNVY